MITKQKTRLFIFLKSFFNGRKNPNVVAAMSLIIYNYANNMLAIMHFGYTHDYATCHVW